MNYNRVILIGNLCAEPVGKTSQAGFRITDLRLAVNRKYKDRQGAEKEDVSYIDVETYNHTADYCTNYLHKGNCVLVEGRLKQDRWIDKTTQKQMSRIRVAADSVEAIGQTRNAPNANGNQNGFQSSNVPPIDFPGDY